MEFILLFIGIILSLLGVAGSFLPALPGPPLSWLGLLCLFFIPSMEWNFWLLGGTLVFTLLAMVFDFIIPSQGTKYFGGSKYGIWGTNIGLILGIFFPPLGFIIGPFLGAFVGEILYDNKDIYRAFRASWGSFLGFLASTVFKFFICIGFFVVFVYLVWKNLDIWF